MTDNTVFQPSSNPAQSQQQAQSNPVQQPPVQIPTPPQAPAFDSSMYEESFPWGLIFKASIGIIVVVVIAFLVFKFVLPRFRSQSTENVALTYWGLWEDEPVMRSIISDFEKQNPTIKIIYIKQDPKQYRERIIARSQNNLGPDIFRFHNTWLPMASNMLLPLSEDVISKKDFGTKYYPVMQKDLTKNGALYGIPLSVDTLSLFVNSDILQSVGLGIPKTWDEFIKVAKQVTVVSADGKIQTAGAAMGTFDNITHAPDILSLLFIQNGADVTNLSGTSGKASDSLSFYVTRFAVVPDNVWDTTLDPSLIMFAKGKLAMYFGFSWDVFTIKSIDPNLKFQVADVPHLPGREMTIASYWVEGVSAKTKHPKEAFLFMNFLTKKDTLIKLYTEESKTRLFGEPYPQMDMADLLKQNELVYPFVRQAKNASSSIFASDTKDNGLNDRANTYLGNAVRSVLGNTSPQSAIDTLSQGVSQVLKQYGQ